MAITFLFTFILTLAKAGIWVSLGIIIYKHYDFVLLLITNKLIPNQEIQIEKKDSICKLLKWIGICLIVLGIASAITSLFTMSFGMKHF